LCARSPLVPFLEAAPSCMPQTLRIHLNAVFPTSYPFPKAVFAVSDGSGTGRIHAMCASLERFLLASRSPPLAKMGIRWSGLFWECFAQVRHHGLDCRTPMLLLGTLTVEWSQNDGHLPIMRGCQSKHPLCEILALVSRIPRRDRSWHWVFLWHVCRVSTH
jgi:hypothetical protein